MSAVIAPVEDEVGGPKLEVGDQVAEVAGEKAEAGDQQPTIEGPALAGSDPTAGDGTGNVPAIEGAEERHKDEAIARMQKSSAPAEVKERMIRVAEQAQDAATVEACLKAVEESLAEFLLGRAEASARREHPAGEVFFRGNAADLTDEEAEEIAQGQLARSGLLRGQRVRVAD